MNIVSGSEALGCKETRDIARVIQHEDGASCTISHRSLRLEGRKKGCRIVSRIESL